MKRPKSFLIFVSKMRLLWRLNINMQSLPPINENADFGDEPHQHDAHVIERRSLFEWLFDPLIAAKRRRG